ncbi:hypothetical protein ACFTZB_04675 [Rhodococcus sp. NPDC057014]|uniref:hypothetical protein n=1 Tax=Rhodococcus sp. NPDC057014 TaxID=3346000 RepID=UPI00363974CB
MSGSGTLIVFAAATPGLQSEFRRWYDEVHIPEVRAAYPELSSVERYDLTPSPQFGSCTGWSSVAVYSVVGDPTEVWSRILADASLGRSRSFDYGSVRVIPQNCNPYHEADEAQNVSHGNGHGLL